MAILKYLLSCHDLVLLVFNGCYDTHRFSKQQSIVLCIVALLTLPVFASTETDLSQQLFRLGLVMPKHNKQCAFFKKLPTKPKYYEDIQISAQSMSLIDRAIKHSCFKGGVTVNWHDYQVLLDRACIQFVQGGERRTISGSGHVQLVGGHFMVIADSFKFNDVSGSPNSIHLEQLAFRLQQGSSAPHWWGHAKSLDILGNDQLRMNQALITSCPSKQPAWAIHSNSIFVDQNRCQLDIDGGQLWLWGAPVLPLPHWSYPLGNQGKTGLLAPIIDHSSYFGFAWIQPWYWKIAQNQDLKISPQWSSQSGLGIAMGYRYLSNLGLLHAFGYRVMRDKAWAQYQHGLEEKYSGIPEVSDELSELMSVSDRRSAWHLQFDSREDPIWSMHIDISDWSDDYMLQQFDPASIHVDGMRVNQEFKAVYRHPSWQASLIWQGPKTLRLLDYDKVLPVYAKLPQIQLKGFARVRDDLWFNWQGELTRFKLRDILDVGDDRPIEIERVVFDPSLVWSKQWLDGLLVAKSGLHAIHSEIRDPVDQEADAMVPWLTVSQQWFVYPDWQKKSSTHWLLKPFLMFHMAPYVMQSDLPLIDTTNNEQGSLMWLDDRRFVGADRYGDSRDLTLMLNSSWRSKGADYDFMSMHVGRRIALRPYKLCLDAVCPGMSEDLVLAGLDVASSAKTHFELSGQYNREDRSWPFKTAGITVDLLSQDQLQFSLHYSHFGENIGSDLAGKDIWTTQFRKDFNNHWHLALAGVVANPKTLNSRDYRIEVGHQLCCWQWAIGWLGSKKRGSISDDYQETGRVEFKVTLTGLGSVGRI